MNFFKRFYKTVAPEVCRFPGVVFSTILVSVFCSIFIFVSENNDAQELTKIIATLSKAGTFAVAFSICAGLAAEFFSAKMQDLRKVKFISVVSQAAAILIAYIPMYPFFNLSGDKFLLEYFGLLFAVLIMCGFFLHGSHEMKNVIPSIIVSGLVAGIISGCVTSGVDLIIAAIDFLLIKVDGKIYFIPVICSAYIFFVNFFLAYVTKNPKEYKNPDSYKVIVKNILFSLYLILLFVLYAYLIKCIVLRQIENSQITLFVSLASIFFLFFYLAIKEYENEKIICFFYKYGYLWLIPLVILQVIFLCRRINFYGFTELRTAGFAYVIFSCFVLVLSALKSGRYMKLCYPVFSVILLAVTCSPLNVIDVSMNSQLNRIRKVLEVHNLKLDENIKIENGDELFSIKEKEILCSAFDFIVYSNNAPEYLNTGSATKDEKFKDTFGFDFSYNYGKENIADRKYSAVLNMKATLLELDISGYKKITELKNIDINKENCTLSIILPDNTSFDITSYFEKEMAELAEGSTMVEAEGPVKIALDEKKDVIITKMDIYFFYEGKNLERVSKPEITAFLLEK